MQQHTLVTHHNLLSFAVHNVEVSFKLRHSITEGSSLKRGGKLRGPMRRIYCKRVTDHIESIIYASRRRPSPTKRTQVVHELNLVSAVIHKHLIEHRRLRAPLHQHVRLLHVVRPALHAPRPRLPVRQPHTGRKPLRLTPRWNSDVRGEKPLLRVAETRLEAAIELRHGARRQRQTPTVESGEQANLLRHAERVPHTRLMRGGKKKGGMMTAALGLSRISGGR